MENIEYYIDGNKFRDYGVIVSSSKGLLAGLAPKERNKTSWKDRHGDDVFLSQTFFEARDIELECNLLAPDLATFMQRINDFSKLFYLPSKRRLKVGIPGNALVYDVFLNGKIDVDKKWRAGQMNGKFTLTLREPEPVKQVYKFTRTAQSPTLNMYIQTDVRLNVSYGDGNFANDIMEAVALTHTYFADGDYYIIISGSLSNMVTTTNAILAWNN